MKTIIINGANGYVASHFISKLLVQKYKIIAFVRPGMKSSPSERMNGILSCINDGGCYDTSSLKVYGYSLLHQNFSIPDEELEEIFKEEVDYFHFAASLKFDEKSKEEIFNTNVGGVENSLKVFSKFAKRNSRFFFIGTAYSCGRFLGSFEEKFYANQSIENFRNYYEQSKRYAENVIYEYNIRHGVNGHIIRLSQVVGNNKTGVTTTDYGIFDFTKRIYSLALRYPNQTVRIHIDPYSTQNLISIDTVVKYLMRTVETKLVPVIMNFVAKNQIQNICIVNILNKLLPINIVPIKKIEHHKMNALERIVSAGMTFTGNYIDTNLQFDTNNLNKNILVSGPEVNESSVYKMLEYFIGNLIAQQEKKAMVS